MWNDTAVTRLLGIELPIVQGPFGGGLSSVDLVAAVCESGGLGSFGAHHLSGEALLSKAAEIRTRTQRPFALNLWIPFEDSDNPSFPPAQFREAVEQMRRYYETLGVPLPEQPARFSPDYPEQIDALLEARPAAFSFVYGIPSPQVLRSCRERDIVTIGTATTAEEAMALEAAGVQLIVATGFEAGGHRVSFMRPAEDSLTGSFALIPQVVDAVSIPVIAAGGIADARGVHAALALGAQAVQIGTAFLACDESNAGELHRSMLFSPAARDTALTRAFSGRLARGIRNRFMDEMSGRRVPRYPVQNWLTAQLKAAAIARQSPQLMSLWAGQSASLLQHHSARDLMAALRSGM